MVNVISISQLTAVIQEKFDADPFLAQVAVRGEISNYKLYPSGHHYFTLKDESAALKCVMFKGNAMRLRFRPENGMQIIAMGKVSVYPRDGAYQMYCTALTVDGIGDLHAAFEQLKAKLQKQGLFDQEHKKQLPQYPGTIGIITSSAGAAVHDMLRIIRKRYPLTRVRILPVRVQGAEAPAEITSAIRYANYYHLADLLIVGRGGGSIEDLWAFNDESVARAIYESAIPVISAVGHEPDVTISDYVSDLRAATPSNGAELAVPDQDALKQQLDSYSASMTASLQRQLTQGRRQLQILASSNVLNNPMAVYENKLKTLELLSNRLLSAQNKCVLLSRHRFSSATAALDALSPLKVLGRGYSMVLSDSGEIIRSVRQVEPGNQINIQVSDGTIHSMVLGTKENCHESE